MEQRIKGTTGLMALIGSPVGHSGSPAMYNFSFRHHNLDYAYMALTSEARFRLLWMQSAFQNERRKRNYAMQERSCKTHG